MADPLDYILVRLDDDIGDKAILAYDAVNDKIVDSGMAGHQGGLQADAGTVSVGVQSISSAGEQVMWLNTDSKVNYAPPWHIIDEISPGGSYDRYYDPIQTITRFAVRTDVVENPKFDVYIPIEEVVFKLNMTFPEAHQDVQFMITHAGHEMWREVRDVNAGTQDIVLDIPIAFHPGTYECSIQPYLTPGIGTNMVPPVRVMGEGSTGKVGYDVVYRQFREVPLASKEYVDAVVAGGVGTDLMTKATYDTNNNGKVDWAERARKVQGVNSAAASTYYGKDAGGNIGFFALPSGADETALKAMIKDNTDEIVNNRQAITKHETAIEGHGTQLATHAKSIATNDNNARTAIQTGQQALNEADTVRANMPNQITADVDNTAKTITLHLISQSGHVDSVLLNLANWFSGSDSVNP